MSILQNALKKVASEQKMRKQAGIYGDYFSAIPSTFGLNMLIPGSGTLANSIGALAGEINGGDLETLAKMEKEPGKAFIPGVGSSRLGARATITKKLLGDKSPVYKTIVGEDLSMLNPLNIVASPIALLAAAINKRRSLAEQAEKAKDDNYVMKSWLIPGYGLYNRMKALGVSDTISRAAADKDKPGFEGKVAKEVLKELERVKNK